MMHAETCQLMQLEKERVAVEDARQQLADKDALIRELSKETTQVDKERYSLIMSLGLISGSEYAGHAFMDRLRCYVSAGHAFL